MSSLVGLNRKPKNFVKVNFTIKNIGFVSEFLTNDGVNKYISLYPKPIIWTSLAISQENSDNQTFLVDLIINSNIKKSVSLPSSLDTKLIDIKEKTFRGDKIQIRVNSDTNSEYNEDMLITLFGYYLD